MNLVADDAAYRALVEYSSSFIILTISFVDPDCFAMVSYDATYIWGSRAQLREGFPMAAHMNGRGLALRVGGAMEIRTIPCRL